LGFSPEQLAVGSDLTWLFVINSALPNASCGGNCEIGDWVLSDDKGNVVKIGNAVVVVGGTVDADLVSFGDNFIMFSRLIFHQSMN